MKEYVRTILDYPVKGIKFRDITTLLQNSSLFSRVINEMTEPWKNEKIDAISLSYDEKTDYDESHLIQCSVRDHVDKWTDLKLDPHREMHKRGG